MISAFMDHGDSRRCAGALVILLLALCLSGCGSSDGDLSVGVQGTAKAKQEEERYRYEGVGKAQNKTLIRRQDERLKELREAAKKSG